jgi:hypothetical protein
MLPLYCYYLRRVYRWCPLAQGITYSQPAAAALALPILLSGLCILWHQEEHGIDGERRTHQLMAAKGLWFIARWPRSVFAHKGKRKMTRGRAPQHIGASSNQVVFLVGCLGHLPLGLFPSLLTITLMWPATTPHYFLLRFLDNLAMLYY